MTQKTVSGWGLSAEGQAALQEILQAEGVLPSSFGSAAYELATRACLQPATVRALLSAGKTLSDLQALAKRVSELAHRLPSRADRVLVNAAAYVASRVSTLEGLQPSSILDQAVAIATVRELVRELIPKARGLDTYAPRRKALSELLLNGQLTSETYKPLKGQDLREIQRLVSANRDLILAVVPPHNRDAMGRVLTKAQEVFGQPSPPALEALNADLAAARTVC